MADKLKVILTYDDGSKVEIEADNPYHAHSIMYYAFIIADEKKQVVRAECPEIDAFMYISDGSLKIKATDMNWVTDWEEVEC